MIEAAVVDACVAVKWVVEELGSRASILWKKARPREITEDDAVERWEALSRSPVTLIPSGELLRDALLLSLEINHPVYECMYLSLAMRSDIPLVTDDRKLVKAAREKRSTVRHIVLLSELE